MNFDHHRIFVAACRCVDAMTRCSADAEDLAQEAFEKAWPRAEELGEDFPRYVCGVARKLALRELRQNARRPIRSLLAEDNGTPTSLLSKTQLATDRADRVESIVNGLPVVDQETLALWRTGLSISKIATLRNEPRGTIASRVFRAVRKLQGLGATA